MNKSRNKKMLSLGDLPHPKFLLLEGECFYFHRFHPYNLPPPPTAPAALSPRPLFMHTKLKIEDL